MEIKKIFEKHDKKNAFIRLTAPAPVEGSQKAALNRKGNQIFNQGDIEGARRIFITTGYSDGMSRVGDNYKSKNRPLEALQMYWLAHNRNKADPLIEKLAFIMQNMLQEDKND